MSVDQKEIHKLSLSENAQNRCTAADLLGDYFRSLSDKYAAWSDIIKLINDDDWFVKVSASKAICSAIEHFPDKHTAWSDLHQLTSNDDCSVRSCAANAIGSVFEQFPDNYAAWSDLHRLTRDRDWHVRTSAVNALGSIIEQFPDKSGIWSDLHQLINDNDWEVRMNAASTVGSVFKYIPDWPVAWSDLHRLTFDEYAGVRRSVAEALASAFEYVPNKAAAESDLLRLTNDEVLSVTLYANHSLGKICIYKASKSENVNDSKALLEEAILYFEKAVSEYSFLNPARFCYLFYRSFDAIIFKKISSREKVQGYILAAKKEVGSSKSRKKLLEAVEQLAEVLETAQSASENELEYQQLLKHCSDICNRVDQLIDENKEKTPAIFELYNKARPSFDKKIKELIDELKEKTEAACRKARGTEAESIACSVNKQVQKWEVGSQEQMKKNLDNLVFCLKMQIPNVSENEVLISKIDEIWNYTKVEDQIGALATIIPSIPTMLIPAKMESLEAKVDSMSLDIEQILSAVKQIEISLKPGIKEEIQVTIGLSGFGSGIQHVITIPIQEISYAELTEDLQKYSDKILDIAKLPRRLKDRIMEYIRKNEDKLEEKSFD